MDRANNINTWGHRGFSCEPLSAEMLSIAGGGYGYGAGIPRAFGRPRTANPERVLVALESTGRPMSCKEICAFLKLCRASVSPMLSELIARGVIESSGRNGFPVAGDKRGWRYRLTPSNDAVAGKL
jgi:hypothetical protein